VWGHITSRSGQLWTNVIRSDETEPDTALSFMIKSLNVSEFRPLLFPRYEIRRRIGGAVR
jgi:hypothetical protein